MSPFGCFFRVKTGHSDWEAAATRQHNMGNTAILNSQALAEPEEAVQAQASAQARSVLEFLALCTTALGFLYYVYQTVGAADAYFEAQGKLANNPFGGIGQGLLAMRLESVGSSAIVFGVLCVILWGLRNR